MQKRLDSQLPLEEEIHLSHLGSLLQKKPQERNRKKKIFPYLQDLVDKTLNKNQISQTSSLSMNHNKIHHVMTIAMEMFTAKQMFQSTRVITSFQEKEEERRIMCPIMSRVFLISTE